VDAVCRRSAGRRLSVLALIHDEDAGPGVFTGYDEVASLALGRPPSLDVASYSAVIVFGGEANVDEEDAHPWLAPEKELLREWLALGTPLLGVCLGAQLVAEVAGARVGPLADGDEIGWHSVVRGDGDDPVLGRAVPERFQAFQWHGYGFDVPPGAIELARGARGAQAFRLGQAWGIQFHAEVDRRTIDGWIRDYGPAAGVDAEALAAETPREIERWNAFGRGLCERFLATRR
jgi:GMP synthase-like glutamine amidotransferase